MTKKAEDTELYKTALALGILDKKMDMKKVKIDCDYCTKRKECEDRILNPDIEEYICQEAYHKRKEEMEKILFWGKEE